jgi:hypothetical protein|tara:strand:- start:184 stop:1431 length:1248 start_codon:yes stop_codon:yes gene_type:complete
MGKELEKGYVIDMNGDEQHENDCVTLANGDICHIDEARYCESDSEYYHEGDDGLKWCETGECWYFEDEMVYCDLYNGGEGWVHQDTDYAYSEYNDTYFQNSETATDCGYAWCERRDDWVPEEQVDEGEEWDNTYKIVDTMFTKTFGMPYTFGVEMETCEGYYEYNSDFSLKAVYDGSIDGKEYVTGVLQGNKGIEHLEKICKAISSECYVDRTCGIHVHIGGANFNRRFAILSIMLGHLMQHQLFRVQPKSRRANTYCKRIPEEFEELRTVNKREFPFTHKRMLRLLSKYVEGGLQGFGKTNCKKSRNPHGHYSGTRYYWLNLNNFSYKDGPETIEFRQHSGSLDYHKIKKWVLFCMCYVNFIENHSRTIIETYNRFQEDKAICISMREVLRAGLGDKEGDIIADYYDNREQRFI